ncbi:YbbR-like domain-containing protein [Desulfobulbus rhabdoformis]|uniref:CdaR family protein n=1 Tax=Desulfobulbus rhabdoformis TaxID=34032 RepID=UPI00196541F2|nr:CdaR family protein [Desulfobulbus rhabdoformis]MBM9614152.1 YbbR-like domain-containing protein [Desulfobulbus rhabdoformis]
MPDVKALSQDWLLKLLSLIIGASLWYFVVGEDRVDLIVTMPLEMRNLPTDLVIANQYKKDIELAISGPRRLIQEMRQQNISLPIDLGQAKPGAMVIQNEAESIPLPQGISVQRVQPATITLLIDQLIQKEFTIEPVTFGKISDDFTLASLSLKPPAITVTGPKTTLDKKQGLRTSPIDLSGLDHSSTLQVHLDLNESLVKLIGETVIEVNVALQEKLVRQTIKKVMVKKPNNSTFSFTPSRVTVEADIPKQVVQETPELSLLLRATILPLKEGAAEAEVHVHAINLPGHTPIVIHSVSPEKVKIKK